MLLMPWVRPGKSPRDNRRPVATRAYALYSYYENAIGEAALGAIGGGASTEGRKN